MTWKNDGFPEALFPLAFAAIGVVLLVGALWRYISRVKIGRPEVSISKDDLRVGESFSVIYEQRFRSATETLSLAVELVLKETVTYRQGTDTRTEKHEFIIDVTESPGRRFEAGEVFHRDCTFTIPQDAMHTFIANNNKLQWFIRVHVDIKDWPDLREEYEIRVLPERLR